MQLTNVDIKNLDKIIYGLINNPLDTVPEIIDGFDKFPPYGTKEEEMYRFYESVLVENKICSIKDGWIANNVIDGFKTLQLDAEGYNIIHSKWSIEQFFDQKSKSLTVPVINIHGNAIIGNNNSGNSQGWDF